MHISGSSYSAFGELFHKIYLEFTNREEGYINIIRAYVIELIIKMFRKMNSAPKSETVTHQTQVVNRTLAYLRENYQKQLSLDELAAQVFLSKDYFARLFRETTGMPISALLQNIRIEEACKLLTGTNKKVEAKGRSYGTCLSKRRTASPLIRWAVSFSAGKVWRIWSATALPRSSRACRPVSGSRPSAGILLSATGGNPKSPLHSFCLYKGVLLSVTGVDR